MTTPPDSASATPIFRPGHDVHVIQAQLAFRDPAAWVLGTLVGVEDDALLVAFPPGARVVVYGTAHARREAAAFERAGPGATVLVKESLSLLVVLPPRAASRTASLFRLEGGAVVEALGADGRTLRLYSVKVLPDRTPVPPAPRRPAPPGDGAGGGGGETTLVCY
jgi:hypothetical protein